MSKPTKTDKPKRERRKRGEHRFIYSEGVLPRCVTCGCDEDEAFCGGQECSYGQKPDWKPE